MPWFITDSAGITWCKNGSDKTKNPKAHVATEEKWNELMKWHEQDYKIRTQGEKLEGEQ